MRDYGRSESRWREEDLDEYEDEEADGYGRYDGYEEEEGGEEDEYEEEEEEEGPQPPTQEEMEFLSTREKLKEKIRQKLRKENGAALGKSGSSSDKKTPPAPSSEFGSFFGPSRPAVSRRVIEERHAMLETRHIRSKEPSTGSDVKRVVGSSCHEEKNYVPQERPKVVKEVKTKAQALKDIRDYSFLFSDDADIPDPAKEKEPKKPPVHSDVRSVEAPRPRVLGTKPSASVPSARDKKMGGPSNHNVQARMQTPMNGLKPSSSGPRNLPGGNVGNGSSRPPVQKVASSNHQNSTMKKASVPVNDRPASMEKKSSVVKPDSSQKRVPDTRESRELPKSKVMGQQASSSRPQLPSSSRPPLPSSSRPQLPTSSRPQQPPSRPQQPTSSSRPQQPTSSSRPQQPTSSSRPQQPPSRQQLSTSSRPQQKVLPRPPPPPSRPPPPPSRPQQTSSSKPQQQMATRPRQSISSRPAQSMPPPKAQSSSSKTQMSKPFKSMAQQRPQENRPKKRHATRYSDEESDDEDAKALSMLRRLTGYNPGRYADDDDDSDMEATFDDIMNEEYRSAKIARKEDEEQLRLIQQEEEEEERRRQMMKAKKRKFR